MSSVPKLYAISYGRWQGLGDEVRRLDLVVNTTPDEVTDKCKTLCEMVLKSILVFAGAKTDDECDSIDMEGLKMLVCQTLSLDSAEADLIKAEITFLARSRNTRGTAGHGRSLQRLRELRELANEKDNERILGIADSLLPYLIDKFETQYPEPEKTLERDSSYDTYLDIAFGKIKIYDMEYPASDVLHELDPVAYATGFKDFSEFEEGEEAS